MQRMTQRTAPSKAEQNRAHARPGVRAAQPPVPPRILSNQARLRQIPPRIQAKLEIGAIDDPLEREADAVADKVMRMTDAGLALSRAPPQGNRKCAECEEQEATVRTKRESADGVDGGPTASVHDIVRASGQPLDPRTRAFFEPRFGRDFSQVRVHTDGGAAQASRQIGAQAFTHGPDIFFAAGKSPSNNALTAHELTHVLQQRGDAGLRQRLTPTGDASQFGPGPSPAGPTFRRVQRLPGDGMRPPGDCGWPQYIELRLSVETAKAITDTLGGCSPGDSCERIALKIAAWSAEIAAREAMAITCFKGGDTGHQEQIRNKIIAFNNCVTAFSGSNCPPELVRAQEAVVAGIRALLALGAAMVAAAMIVALIVAIIGLAQVVAALVAAAAAAAPEAAAVAAAAAAVIALLVGLKDMFSSHDSGAA
jgi:Domain of unknown function (DUF4157)/Novel toxin 16